MNENIDEGYIKSKQEDFISDDELADVNRASCLGQIASLQSLLSYRVNAIANFNELDSQTMMYYSDIKSITEYIDNLYNTVLRMDNLRVESIGHLIQVLKELQINLEDGVKKYDT